MSDSESTQLDEFLAGTSTETINRTIRFPLQTSARKNDLVRTGIEEYQAMVSYMADMLPSFPEYRWQSNDTQMYRMVTEEFDDSEVKATIARTAEHQVADSFRSWKERGKPGNRPQFGSDDFLRLSHQDVTLERNAEGFGIRASFIPYNPVWFHAKVGDYQRGYLETALSENGDTGSAELILDDDGTLFCHLVVKKDVEVYDPGEVSQYVGVDLGEDVIYAAAVVDTDGEVKEVEVEPGGEFRHHRERLNQKRERLSRQGDLEGVRKCRGEREKYTEQVTHTATRRIVDLAADHAPCCIRIEDLTHYRDTAEEAIHDWPFAQLQQQIAYKAREAGIPVEAVEPYQTSITCRKCKQSNPEYRDGNDFHCTRCGYEIHADVNAAINIGTDLNGD